MEVGERDLSSLGELPLTREAIAYAKERYGDQRRPSDGGSYVLHPLEVASLLERSGYSDEVVAAAVLHDVLEDTETDRSELDARFGERVGELVALVSDDPAIEDEEQRKDETRERVRRAGGAAAAVYAADKISKVRELRTLLERDPHSPGVSRRLARHRKSLHMLEQRIPASRLVEILRFELEAVEHPPQDQTR